jgi:nitroreductase
MEFSEIVMKRYATKKYDGKAIPKEKVDKLFEIIRYAPSSFNFQPWKIKVVADKETKEKLAPAAWNQPQITSCSHLLVFCADTDLKGIINRLERAMPDAVDYIKTLRGFAEKMDEAQTLAWSQRQVYIALGNAVNGAKSLGFDSSPMEGFMPGEFAKILKLPKNIVPTVLCAIGYAADTPRPKFRFSKEEVFF